MGTTRVSLSGPGTMLGIQTLQWASAEVPGMRGLARLTHLLSLEGHSPQALGFGYSRTSLNLQGLVALPLTIVPGSSCCV